MSSKRPPNFSKLKKRWKVENPPDANGNYICWICKLPVHESKMTLDHVAPVELYPEYAKDFSNLRPSHAWCNEERARGRNGTLKTLRGRKILSRRRR